MLNLRTLRGRPRDESVNPPTVKSADGSTTLKRFRVDGVIYAPSKRAAQARLEQACIYLDDARITP